MTWYRCPVEATAPSRSTVDAGFVMGEIVEHRHAGGVDRFRSYRCRRCGREGTVATPHLPGPHACKPGAAACTCRMTRLVEGLRAFYVDGDNPECPVHGGGPEEADLTPASAHEAAVKSHRERA